jgi:hypothetical protein
MMGDRRNTQKTTKNPQSKQVPSNKHNKKKNTHYPRVINSTNTQFTPVEIQVLSKGLKYNLHHKHKNWMRHSG